MNFSTAVMISVLLYHRAISSSGSVLSDTSLSKGENVLEQFFAELEPILENYDLVHVTIAGASAEQFRQTKSLLEAFPYFVGQDMKGFCESRGFASHGLIVYFLESLRKEYVTEVAKSLSNCKKNPKIFIYEGAAAPNKVDVDFVLHLVHRDVTLPPIFLHHNEISVKVYQYRITADCSRKFEFIVDWTPGIDLRILKKNWFDVEGCPVSVGAMHQPPWMNLAEDGDGVVRIIGGAEGNMISTIAQTMNFTPLVKNYLSSDEKTVHGRRAIITNCAAGNIDAAIAQIRPTKNIAEAVDISQPYLQKDIVWCVPRIPRWESNIMTSEFTWETWVSIGLTFLVSLVVEKILRNARYLNRGNADRSGFSGIILDLIGSTIGNPIVYRPLSIGGKAMLIIYISYSTVITTAYKTSLSSILTAKNSESSIIDVEGIIKANLTTGGDTHRLAILEDQIGENELIPELIKRFVIEPNISRALRRVSYDKNFAYLTTSADLAYHTYLLEKSGEHMSYEVLSEPVLIHSLVMIFPKSSQMGVRMSNVTQSLAASGLLQYWMINDSMKHRVRFPLGQASGITNAQKELYDLTKNKFQFIFMIYCLAMIFCIFIFIGEIIVHKFNLADRFSRLNRIRRF